MTTTQNLIYRLRKRAITTLTLSQAADALEALQADVVRLNMALHGYQVAIETTEESLKDRVALAMEVERLKAAGAVDCGHRPPCTECSDYAAPIPQPPAPSDTAITYMTGYSDGREWAQPSQADAQDAARYRWLRSTTNWASNSSNERIDVRNSPELWDAAIDAAIQKELTP